MLRILKNIINSFFILIIFAVNVEARNSKDVSNIQVQKKSISHKQKYSWQLVKSKDGDKPYPPMVVYFDEVNLGSTKEKVIKNIIK